LTPVTNPDMKFATTQNAYSHTIGLTSCTNCHSANRPAPVNGFVHYANNDCVSCHHPGSTNNTNGFTQAQIESAFLTAYAYTHPTTLTSCASCHEKNRPSAATGHVQGADCVSCHHTNDTWTSTLTDAQIQSIWLMENF
jgi:hypothetical protein